MAHFPGWLEDGAGAAVQPIPDDAFEAGYQFRYLVGRRVYERSRPHADGTWIYTYQMTEPAAQ